jgi:hypothetical protein
MTVKDFFLALPTAPVAAVPMTIENKKPKVTVVPLLPHLPEELWNKVVAHLQPQELRALSIVNRRFHEMTNNADVWRSSLKKWFNDTNDVLVPTTCHPKAWYLNWRSSLVPNL